MTRIVTGLFDNRGDAERTVEHLVQELGIDAKEVEVHAAEQPRQGLLRSLGALLLPQGDRHSYGEAIRRGGIVVTAQVEEAMLDRAMDAFEANGAANLDEREAAWREEGWTGYTGHDEDIGFATYGGDVVVGRVPREHHDDAPAGAMGRLEQAAAQRDEARSRPRVRSYLREAPDRPGPGRPGSGRREPDKS